MKKYERVMNVLEGKENDYTPSGFWLHFPKENVDTLDKNIKEHIKFLEETDIDLFKVMNENEFRSKEKIEDSKDWLRVPLYNEEHPLLKNQKELLTKLVEINNKNTVILGTVHGIVASLSHSSGISYTSSPEIMKKHFVEDKESIMQALNNIAESTINMARITAQSGVDGIYYAALGGERSKFTDEEFEKYIKPVEMRVFNEIRKMTKLLVLHVCKDNVELKRYQDYPFDVLNWGINETTYTLDDGFELFKDKVIMGGFDDRSGILVEANKEEIEAKTNEILNDMKGKKFILGADCTLPTEIEYSRIKWVVDASKNFGKE